MGMPAYNSKHTLLPGSSYDEVVVQARRPMNPSLSTLIGLADVLGMTTAELMDGRG